MFGRVRNSCRNTRLRTARVSTAFLVLLNFYSCHHNLMETRKAFFYFLNLKWQCRIPMHSMVNPVTSELTRTKECHVWTRKKTFLILTAQSGLAENMREMPKLIAFVPAIHHGDASPLPTITSLIHSPRGILMSKGICSLTHVDKT